MPLPDQPTPSKFSSKLARMGCVSFCLSQANRFDFSYMPHISLCIFDFFYLVHKDPCIQGMDLTFPIPSYTPIVDHQTGSSKFSLDISPTSLSLRYTFIHREKVLSNGFDLTFLSLDLYSATLLHRSMKCWNPNSCLQ